MFLSGTFGGHEDDVGKSEEGRVKRKRTWEIFSAIVSPGNESQTYFFVVWGLWEMNLTTVL